MAKRARPLTFAEFGQQFMVYAVTSDVIQQSLRHIVPREQQLTLSSPSTVRIDARTTIGDVVPRPTDRPEQELGFEVHLSIRLTLAVNMLVGQEQYAAVATTRLRLMVGILAPLTIFIDCAPVTADQVIVASEGQGNWFDLVKRLGILDAAIQQQVATIVNEHIQSSKAKRRIDVRKLIAGMIPTVIDTTARRSHHASGAKNVRV